MQIDLGSPQPKQIEFLTATASYVAYGGARGGGKSWAVDFKAVVMALAYGGIRQLILRRTYPELLENHIRPLTTKCAGIARYKDADKTLTFVNGSLIKFGYCASDQDLAQYQGQEYNILYFQDSSGIFRQCFSVSDAVHHNVLSVLFQQCFCFDYNSVI